MTSNTKLPGIYYFDLKKSPAEKKWLNKDLNITDYFNYGLQEDLWKCYTNKVRKLY